MKLTIKSVEGAAPGSGDVFLWCSEVKRFGLRVKPSGVKSFLIQYRTRQGKSKRLTIGQYPTWTPEQAREHAKALLRLVDQGADPAQDIQAERGLITMDTLLDEYQNGLESGTILARGGKGLKPRTLINHRWRMDKHVRPRLGRAFVKDVSSGDILRLFQAVAASGGPFAAKRTIIFLQQVMTYAKRAGYRDGDNPATGLTLPADKKRKFRLESDGWKAFGALLATQEGKGANWRAVSIARLLALTGCRSQEITGLRWPEVDFDAHAFRFEESRVKSGPLRPIGQQALDILAKLYGLHDTDNPLVFPAVRDNSRKGGGAFAGLPDAWERWGLPYSPHCLRHAFAGAADDLELAESTIGALLGHSSYGGGSRITRGYIKKMDKALVAAADQVAGHIFAMMACASQN
jgi:integrase